MLPTFESYGIETIDEAKFNEMVKFVVDAEELTPEERMTFHESLCTTHESGVSLWHHTLGRTIRNMFKLWTVKWEPDIKEGVDYSKSHPDSISMTVIHHARAILLERVEKGELVFKEIPMWDAPAGVDRIKSETDEGPFIYEPAGHVHEAQEDQFSPELLESYNDVFTKGHLDPISICARLNLSGDKLVQYCASAFTLANLSRCIRRKTGALVIDFYDGVPTIVGSGCNGGPAGGTNACETGPCLSQTKEEIIHSEVNAMRSLPVKNSTRILVCTDSPCGPCLEAIKANGTIDLMIFVREYRIVDHLESSDIPWAVVDQYAIEDALEDARENMFTVISTQPEKQDD